MSNSYEKSAASQNGLDIDPYLRCHANWLCDIQLEEQRLEALLIPIVHHPDFKLYNQIFDQFSFGNRIRAKLLSRIYPFESFLLPNGKPLIEREVREVKRKEVTRESGQRVVKFSPGDVKRVKRNRSRDIFKIRLGMGTVLEQSGDKLVEKSGGSKLCRNNFWQYIITKVEVSNRLPLNNITTEIMKCQTKLIKQVDAQGKPLLNGKHIQNKLMSKVANMLFRELVKKLGK